MEGPRDYIVADSCVQADSYARRQGWPLINRGKQIWKKQDGREVHFINPDSATGFGTAIGGEAHILKDAPSMIKEAKFCQMNIVEAWA